MPVLGNVKAVQEVVPCCLPFLATREVAIIIAFDKWHRAYIAKSEVTSLSAYQISRDFAYEFIAKVIDVVGGLRKRMFLPGVLHNNRCTIMSVN